MGANKFMKEVMANALNCDVFVSEFELQTCYYLDFLTWEMYGLSAMGSVAQILFFYKDNCSIK